MARTSSRSTSRSNSSSRTSSLSRAEQSSREADLRELRQKITSRSRLQGRVSQAQSAQRRLLNALDRRRGLSAQGRARQLRNIALLTTNRQDVKRDFKANSLEAYLLVNDQQAIANKKAEFSRESKRSANNLGLRGKARDQYFDQQERIFQKQVAEAKARADVFRKEQKAVTFAELTERNRTSPERGQQLLDALKADIQKARARVKSAGKKPSSDIDDVTIRRSLRKRNVRDGAYNIGGGQRVVVETIGKDDAGRRIKNIRVVTGKGSRRIKDSERAIPLEERSQVERVLLSAGPNQKPNNNKQEKFRQPSPSQLTLNRGKPVQNKKVTIKNQRKTNAPTNLNLIVPNFSQGTSTSNITPSLNLNVTDINRSQQVTGKADTRTEQQRTLQTPEDPLGKNSLFGRGGRRRQAIETAGIFLQSPKKDTGPQGRTRTRAGSQAVLKTAETARDFVTFGPALTLALGGKDLLLGDIPKLADVRTRDTNVTPESGTARISRRTENGQEIKVIEETTLPEQVEKTRTKDDTLFNKGLRYSKGITDVAVIGTGVLASSKQGQKVINFGLGKLDQLLSSRTIDIGAKSTFATKTTADGRVVTSRFLEGTPGRTGGIKVTTKRPGRKPKEQLFDLGGETRSTRLAQPNKITASEADVVLKDSLTGQSSLGSGVGLSASIEETRGTQAGLNLLETIGERKAQRSANVGLSTTLKEIEQGSLSIGLSKGGREGAKRLDTTRSLIFFEKAPSRTTSTSGTNILKSVGGRESTATQQATSQAVSQAVNKITAPKIDLNIGRSTLTGATTQSRQQQKPQRQSGRTQGNIQRTTTRQTQDIGIGLTGQQQKSRQDTGLRQPQILGGLTSLRLGEQQRTKTRQGITTDQGLLISEQTGQKQGLRQQQRFFSPTGFNSPFGGGSAFRPTGGILPPFGKPKFDLPESRGKSSTSKPRFQFSPDVTAVLFDQRGKRPKKGTIFTGLEARFLPGQSRRKGGRRKKKGLLDFNLDI